MSDITELQARIVAFRNDRNWKQFHNPKDMTISLVLEASELLEHFQWKNGEEIAEHIKNHKGEVADELADVLYWVLLIAHDLDIDLVEASKVKHQKNVAKYPVEKAKDNHKKYHDL